MRTLGFYDSYGNPKQWFKHGSDSSEIKYALGWSQVNRLTEITDIDTNERYEYTYNSSGIRTNKRVGNTEYEYFLDGSNIIAETRTTGESAEKLIYYYETTGIVGFNCNGTDYYYQKNIQGDIIRIYNESGTICGMYSYDAWGKRTVILDSNGIASINPFGYRGYYLDNETGLWYLNSRYYDSEVGRFLTPDSLDYLAPETLGGLNRYTYCGNNPVNYYDPSGHLISLIVVLMITGAIAGASLGGLIAGFTAYNNGSRGWDLFGSILLGTLGGGAIGVVAGFAMGVLGPAIGGLGVKVLGDTLAASAVATAFAAGVELFVAASAVSLVASGAVAAGNISMMVSGKPSSGPIRFSGDQGVGIDPKTGKLFTDSRDANEFFHTIKDKSLKNYGRNG